MINDFMLFFLSQSPNSYKRRVNIQNKNVKQ